MAVDRCVCHEVSFAELKELARSAGCTLEELRDKTNCCTGCGMCGPYVRLMLKTGQTSFEPMLPDQIEQALLRLDDPRHSS